MPQNEAPSPSRALEVRVDHHPIPTLLWTPEHACRAVVVALHGGSGHKSSPAIEAIVRRCLPLGLAVLAIDGPVHGARALGDATDPVAAKQRFREAWRAGVGRFTVAQELSAALDALQAEPAWAGLPVGYIGVSMGTAYGIPFLAHDTRIRAAAIGLWSTTYPASEHLAGLAGRIRCAVWFTQQWDDEAFERSATQALFDAVGSEDKRLVAYPGGHRELEGERLQDAVGFVASRLLQPSD